MMSSPLHDTRKVMQALGLIAASIGAVACAASPTTTAAEVHDCDPAPGFDYCVRVHVDIESSPAAAFAVVSDIERTGEFFPDLEFRFDQERAIATGDTYYSRRVGTRRWSSYRFVAVEPDARMSGELVEGGFPFGSFRYDHRFFAVGSGVRSEERLDYSLKLGVPRRMAERKIRESLVGAHVRLKRELEGR